MTDIEGHNLLDAGEGEDTLIGGHGGDVMDGGEGNDLMRGEGSCDVLRGGAGNDTLDGGSSSDILAGGLGQDRFMFSTGHDIIQDFTVGQDVLQIGAQFGVSSFSALMARAYSADAGRDTVIYLNHGAVVLDGVTLASLSASDFVFG